ncbi:MAG TPA: ANTAR domain-containing protein [Clostridia bacterium]|jgi:response regulator NasT|nr:MAG: putative transcriptional regulatory protein pdtaR [Firmicutes bacterium ADurb.Bin146]HOD93278.1 ANTAR domain-containing protein [Clostridia bacterium]HQM39330.1 ANTAR domain-containing protein [Clostridia bacterium]
MERRYNSTILIVASNDRHIDFFNCTLCDEEKYVKTVVKTSNEARNLLIERTFDAVIINAPLPDEFGIELAKFVSLESESGVMLLVRNETFEEIAYSLEHYGILVVSKPVIKAVFMQTLKLALATKGRFEILEKKNQKLENKLAQIKIVNHAKWLLIQYRKMDEYQAHKYIERQAMDNRITLKEVAEGIIKKYEG